MRNYKKKVKVYTAKSIEAAINEVVHGGKSVKSVAKKYHMSTSMLRKRVMEHRGDFERKKQVRITYLLRYI